jgi:outer membrane protein OmpA-like peptidoglycan-associated protein
MRIFAAPPAQWRRIAEEGILPKDVNMRSIERKVWLAGALLGALAMAPGPLASDAVAAEPGAGGGPIILAQNPPPCGKDPQHPCPKGQQPAPKQPPQQRPPQPPPQQQRPVQVQPQPQQQRPVQQQQRPVQVQPQQQQQQQQQKPAQIQPPPQRQLPPGHVQPAQAQPQGQPGGPPPGGPQGQPPRRDFQRVQPAQGQPAQGLPAQGLPAQGQAAQPQGQPNQFQRAAHPPGGPAFGNIQQLQNQRHERVEAGGRTIIEEPDHRQIVRQNGQAFIRHDEAARFLRFGDGRLEQHGNETFSIVARPDGFQIVTVTDPDGRLVRRFRRGPDGREYVLIDNRLSPGGYFLSLPPPLINIPQDQYIVDTGYAQEPLIYDTLEAPSLGPIERPYSLDEIRYNVALRDRMRRIDVDTINFDTGSWEVTPDQVGRLDLIAEAIRQIVSRNPNEVFLIEGHTDAVGNDVDNLSLSDRRAETIADILTETYQIPPENLTTQGYGEQFLKIPTPEANRQNRRVTVRRITPLLVGRN